MYKLIDDGLVEIKIRRSSLF